MGSKRRRGTTAGRGNVTSLADALFSKTQQRVFSLLFGQPERRFTTSELIALAASGSGAVQRELQRLVDSKLIVSTLDGRQRRYQANSTSPIFTELHAIVEKTAGIPEQLRRALASLAQHIQLALLFGSVAKETDTASSDIDVLLVSDELALDDVFAALERAEQRLGRRVSPTLYTSKEFHRRRRAGQPFLTRLLDGPLILLVGSEDAVSAT